jgi:hypothetical protein
MIDFSFGTGSAAGAVRIPQSIITAWHAQWTGSLIEARRPPDEI